MAVEFLRDHELSSGHTALRAGSMWRWKATKKRAGMKSHVLRTRIADSRSVFAEALPFGLS